MRREWPILVVAWLVLSLQVFAMDHANFQEAQDLSSAAESGDLKTIERLLKAGLSPNLPNRYKRIPLEYAALSRDFDTVQVLLSSGADRCAKTNLGEVKNGETISDVLNRVAARAEGVEKVQYEEMRVALESQECGGSFALGRFQDARKRGETRINAAIARGKMLADQAARPELYKRLRLAAAYGDVAAIKELLKEGLYPASPDPEGWTALHLAAEQGHAEAVALLLEKGVPADIETNNGRTSLQLAMAAKQIVPGHFRVVDLLLKNGAQINHQDKSGYCPVHTVANGRNLEFVKFALSKGADVNCQARNGSTAIHLEATYHGDVAIVRALLAAGANPRLKASANGLSSIEVARETGKVDILKLMESAPSR